MTKSDLDVRIRADNLVLQVKFTNHNDSSYYLDKKLAFWDGKYTLDCLEIASLDGEVNRKKRVKVKYSKFPEDFIEIEAHAAIEVKLNLEKHFDITPYSKVRVLYKCFNQNPITNELDDLISNTIEIDLE